MRRGLRGLVVAGIAAGGLAATATPAAAVTIGSPLTQAFPPTLVGGAATFVNTSLAEQGAHVSSPIDGTIVSWRLVGAIGGPFRLRVIRPSTGGAFTGAGTSSPQIPMSTGLQTFATNLAIKAGDLIGVDDNSSSDQMGSAYPVPGGSIATWHPPLADGATATPYNTGNSIEYGFNAEVIPPNAFTFKLNGRKLLVSVSSTGTVEVSDAAGPGLAGTASAAKKKKQKLLLNPSSASGGPPTITVPLALTKKAKKKLKKKHKLKLNARITFTPTGGLPKTQTATLTLKGKKHRKKQ